MKKIFIFSILLILTGCSSATQRESIRDTSFKNAAAPGSEDTASVSEKNRIILYNAYYKLESEDTEKTSKTIASIAQTFGGYIVSAGTTEVVIRVPADKFDSALVEVEKAGEGESKRVYSEDVTDTFRDTEIRLESKLKARDRYLELLKKAENVNAAVNVERELERLNGEIEEMKGRLKRLSHLAKYSTITVTIEEKIKPGPLGYIFIGAWKVVKWLFVRN
jgi:hypothetical protein